MKAIVCQRYGRPQVLKIKHLQKPAPRENEVLVKVIALTATQYDCWMRRGSAPPDFWLLARMCAGLIKPRQPILGTELAGVVESGEIRPIIDRCCPFAKVFNAPRNVESGCKMGNVVIMSDMEN